jgi:hypothetical protein
LPVQHPVLRKSKLIKNARFESVVELYREDSVGSAQYHLEAAAKMLEIDLRSSEDLNLLRNVALLPAFDVFSVRLLLREMGIQVDDNDGLALPPATAEQLDAHMRKFTIPLLRYVYGDQALETATLQQLIRQFRDPDVERAGAHLKRLAEKFGIPVSQVPRFLEDYSDTFLAIALYQHTLAKMEPSVDAFLRAVERLAADSQFQKNRIILASLNRVDSDFRHIIKSVAKRLGASERLIKLLWSQNSDGNFATLQTRIREFHFLIAYLLCGIAAKVNAWNAAFPAVGLGNPARRAELITTDITVALEQLRKAADGGLSQIRRPHAARESSGSLQSFLRSIAIS